MLLFVNGENEQVCGALSEVFVVSPDAWTFSHHPNCRNCLTLADAIVAVVAMQAGEATGGYSASISGTNSPRSSCWLGNPPQRVEPER